MSNISSELHAPPRLGGGSLLGAALESLRPYQWLKNALVFVPLAAAHRLGEPQLLMRGAAGVHRLQPVRIRASTC